MLELICCNITSLLCLKASSAQAQGSIYRPTLWSNKNLCLRSIDRTDHLNFVPPLGSQTRNQGVFIRKLDKSFFTTGGNFCFLVFFCWFFCDQKWIFWWSILVDVKYFCSLCIFWWYLRTFVLIGGIQNNLLENIFEKSQKRSLLAIKELDKIFQIKQPRKTNIHAPLRICPWFLSRRDLRTICTNLEIETWKMQPYTS